MSATVIYIIYINDFSLDISIQLNLFIYVDDTNIIKIIDDILDVIQELNNALKDVKEWCTSEGLK